MSPSDERAHGGNPSAGPAGPAEFPRYVRHLAVAYVLSHFVGPAGFVVLGVIASMLALQRNWALDATVLGVWLAALACPLCCAAFRWWFRSWGRRHWPPAEPPAATSEGNTADDQA
jgi:hypothetical protein